MTVLLCFSPDIFVTTESGRMRWAGLEKHIGRREISIGSLCGNRKERDPLADLGVDGSIILK
jgi:hypothetical protein